LKFKRALILLVIAMLLSTLAAGCGGNAQSEGEDPNDQSESIKVGWVYIGVPGDHGWTYAHDQGRQYLEAEIPGVESIILENVPEGADAARSFEQLAQEGCSIIFGNTFGYADAMLAVAKKYPEVKFMHATSLETADNLGTYFGRIYQARYLSGMIAGAMTENKQLGYVAAFPIPEVVRGINAFTLGVQAVNPEATVKVVWTNTWFDPTKEKEAAKSLLEAGCDVIAQHQDTAEPQVAAEDAGKYSIGYNSDMREFAPNANLTSPIWNWGPFYVDTVKSVLDGTWTPDAYWGGMDEGIVDLAPISDQVPAEIVQEVEAKKQAIINKEWDVFTGPIKAQDGSEKVAEGQVMTDAEMLSMDWFVAGVQGTL
jgi:basic membrane protein A